MKLSDIFNLPKNAQGNKLFKKITNKYGLSKEDYKALKNIKIGEDDFPTSKYIYLKADIKYSEIPDLEPKNPLLLLYTYEGYDNGNTPDGIISRVDMIDIIYKLDYNGEIIYTKDADIYYDDNIIVKGLCVTQYVQSDSFVSGSLKYHKNVFTDIRSMLMIYPKVKLTKEEIDKYFTENAISAEEFWDNAEIVKYV